MRLHPTPARVLLLLLGVAMLATLLPGSSPARAAAPPAGTLLPVFTMDAPAVSGPGTANLAGLFDAFSGAPGAGSNTYGGLPRFVVPSTDGKATLERYSATGGFYAANPEAAFSEAAQGSLTVQQAIERACAFLFQPNDPQGNFINVDGTLLVGHDAAPGGQPTPQSTVVRTNAPGDCTKPNYTASLIYGASETPGGAPATPQVLGAVVQAPLYILIGLTPVPLAGAGGHMSFLIRPEGAGGFSLDGRAPGLSALSLPFYGRETAPLQRNGQDAFFPMVDPAQARAAVDQRVRAAFPGAESVSVPEPELVYNVDEAGVPQRLLEPELRFGGVEVVVGGETLILRDILVPAIAGGPGGLGPSVSITAPASGSTFAPGSNVVFQGTIGDGTAPYSYTWELEDGTPLASGTLAAPGQVQAQSSQLPVVSHGGVPAATTVVLRVTDAEGVEREALVSIRPTVAPALFLPLTPNGAAPAALALPADVAPKQAGLNYSFGVEANNDYPPFGVANDGDLPGVVGDANGFRNGMQSFGWPRRFDWRNSAAWERDWRDCGLGGADCSYGVDRADFVYYAGHGGPGGLGLATNIDSTWFDGANARFSRLRWAGFASCQTLRAQWSPASDAPIRRWFNAFQGAHMLLGFNSNMRDVAFGGPLVDRMRPFTFLGITIYQPTIREAWVQTAFNLNAGKPSYIYARGTNGVNPADNRLPAAGDAPLARPSPIASWHWVWWDCSVASCDY